MAGLFHVRVRQRADVETNRDLGDLFDVVRRLADRGTGASFRSKLHETDARIFSRDPPTLYLGGFSQRAAHRLHARIEALGHNELEAKVRIGFLGRVRRGR